MKVGIIALLQETNTFVPGLTTIADFAGDILLHGEAVREQFAAAHHEIGGFFAGLADAGIEAVPLFAARAVPAGPIDAQTLELLIKGLLESLSSAGPLHGVLVAVHGATAGAKIRDVDGHWLSAVRRQVGSIAPIVGTLDPHANLSPAMVAACDALVAYRTNPHLDQRERGLEAALLMTRTLRGEIRPRMAAAYPPVVINIECQNPSEPPCREWFDQLESCRAIPGVIGSSLLLGFPYADVEEMGAATLVIADDDLTLAEREANRLASWLWEHRREFTTRPVPTSEAIARTKQMVGPVCLLDVGDNVGGGGPGDATYLVQALCDAQVSPALVCLNDPQAVEAAEKIGTGGSYEGEVGGKSCHYSGAPMCGRFHIRRVVSGQFSESLPRHGGFVSFDQGRTAVLESSNGLTVITTSKRTPPFSLAQITSCGVDPRRFHVIVAKGVHAPLAAYREVCSHFIRVDTPGTTTANFTQLSFQHRRKPLYPFEHDFEW